jgi:hypothetical protein
VPEVRQVEAAEAGQRHARAPHYEIVFGTPAARAVLGADVERLPAPFRKDLNGIVERPRIRRAELQSSRKLPLEPFLRSMVDLLAQLSRNSRLNHS